MPEHVWCLYIIAKIRRYLSQNPAKTTVHGCITSYLEYFNILWFPYISDKSDKWTSTRREFCSPLVTPSLPPSPSPVGWGEGEHYTDTKAFTLALCALQNDFKILLLTYKALSSLVSSFIRDLLRRWNMALFIKCKTLKKGGRAFRNIGKNIYIYMTD